MLDHHKTAFEMFDRPAVGNVSFDIDNCWVNLDMDRSGATLALDHWQPRSLTDGQRQMFLYIEDADLWRWKLRESRQFHAGVQDALSLCQLHAAVCMQHAQALCSWTCTACKATHFRSRDATVMHSADVVQHLFQNCRPY